MTDKQIIIDGIDVSGCCQYMPRYMEDYDIDILDYCRHHFKPCKDVDVKYCYYKQLKCKEQECESYKQTLREIQQDLEYATYCESQECGCDDANECLECTKNKSCKKLANWKNEEL